MDDARRSVLRWLSASGTTLAALAASGCSPLVALNGLIPTDGYTSTQDIAYGAAKRQKLDVYAPVEPSPTRSTVVFIYGGSWSGGRKEYYPFVGEALTSQGFCTVIPDYRLYPDVRFPAFIDDVAAAFGWTKTNIAQFGCDPQRVFLMGHSAGAHSAAMVALNEKFLSRIGCSRGDVCGLVGLAGPYGFDPFLYDDIRPIFETAASAAETQPLAFVDAGAPPALLLHGEEDRIVYPENSRALAARLRESGNKAEFVPYADIGHYRIILDLAAPFRGSTGVLADTSRFILSV